jgi:hypothetical protein
MIDHEFRRFASAAVRLWALIINDWSAVLFPERT